MINLIEHGTLLLKEGKFEEAKTFALEQLAKYKETPISEIEHYEMLSILAFSYIRRSLANDAIPIVKEMHALCSEMTGEDRMKREFRCNNILGLLHFELTRLQEALTYLEQAYEIAIKIDEKDTLSTITGNLGLVHSAMSNDVKALELLRHSESLSIELGTEDHLAIVCDNIATIFTKHGDYTNALEYYTKALDLHKRYDIKDGIGRALGHIGSVYMSMNDYPIAERYFLEALAIHEDIDYKRGIETWNELMGDLKMAINEPECALMHYSRAIEINRELGNRGFEAVHIGSLGNVHLHNGDLEKAFSCFEQALEILSEYDRKGDYYDIQLQKANILYNPNFPGFNPKEAEEVLLNGLNALRELSLKAIEMNYLLELSEYYKTQKDWEKAYTYHVESIAIKEAIFSNSVRDNIKEMEFQKAYHEMEEKKMVEMARLQEKEQLLHEILPSRIAEKIIQGEQTIAEECTDMTIMFADIVGFTSISEKMSPSEIVKILNEVYSQLDIIADKHGIEKIKTIGDAYMAICNVGEDIMEHRSKMFSFAKEVIEICNTIIYGVNNTLQVRIGIHSGPTVAGVVGTKKYSYDVWGDAVNTAARMESYGEAGTIQVSKEFYESVKQLEIVQSMKVSAEREIAIKGKGLMQTVILK